MDEEIWQNIWVSSQCLLCWSMSECFCSYYIGAQPYIVILDPNMIKEITIKQFDNFTERRVSKIM